MPMRGWVCGSVEGGVDVSKFMCSVVCYVVFKVLILKASGRYLLASTFLH
jgi:hypothetical protein